MNKFEVIREAHNLKKIARLGAVPMADFEALKKDVQIQRVGFLALAGLQVIQIVKPKKAIKAEISEDDIDKIAGAIYGFKTMNNMTGFNEDAVDLGNSDTSPDSAQEAEV